jgi:hypothetical protein
MWSLPASGPMDSFSPLSLSVSIDNRSKDRCDNMEDFFRIGIGASGRGACRHGL